MLAYIAHHEPVDRLPGAIGWTCVLNERNVSPRCRRQSSRIVIAVACQFIAIRRQLIPLLTCHFASFTANTERGVGKKSMLTHKRYALLFMSRFTSRPVQALYSKSEQAFHDLHYFRPRLDGNADPHAYYS